MAPSTIHLLHLDARSLRWAVLESRRSQVRLDLSGSFEGTPVETLAQWAQARRDDPGQVYLYDGRPIYFTFSLRLPADLRRQADSAIALKIRQELSLDPETVSWSTRSEPVKGQRGQLDFFVTVVRRESIEDLRQWSHDYQGGDVWVGADVEAIGGLARQGIVPRPCVLVNGDGGGATVYHLPGQGPISRGRIERKGDKLSGHLPEFELNGATPRAAFGPAELRAQLAQIPALAGLSEAPDSGPRGLAAWGKLGEAAAQLEPLDAVLAGGLVQAFGRGGRAGSLLHEERTGVEIDLRAPAYMRLKVLVPAALAAIAFLLLVIVTVRTQLDRDRLNLIKRANSIASDTKRLRSLQGVLRQVETDRSPVLPVFELLMENLPPDTYLQTFNLSETGALQINGISQARQAPADFSMRLSKSPLLERVELPEFRSDADGRVFNFQITARMKGRGKK